MLGTNIILFSVAGYSVSLLELLSVATGLSCVFLAGRGKKLNFWFGYVYCILLFFLFMHKQLYSSMILQPISLFINIFGHYRWTHPRKGEEDSRQELKVTSLGIKKTVFHLFLIIIAGFIWGLVLNHLGSIMPATFPAAKLPYLDAVITMTILTAQYLSAQKKIECWAAWTIVNTTNIVLYILAGLVFMPLVSACYLILAFFGFAAWKKLMKK